MNQYGNFNGEYTHYTHNTRTHSFDGPWSNCSLLRRPYGCDSELCSEYTPLIYKTPCSLFFNQRIMTETAARAFVQSLCNEMPGLGRGYTVIESENGFRCFKGTYEEIRVDLRAERVVEIRSFGIKRPYTSRLSDIARGTAFTVGRLECTDHRSGRKVVLFDLELSRPWHVHGLPRNRLVEDGVFWAHPKYDPCVVEC